MDDTVNFFILIAIGAISVFFGFSMLFPGTGASSVFGASPSLSANISSVIGSGPAENSSNPDTVLYMSYDNLENIFPVTLKNVSNARATVAVATDNYQTLFLGTTRGLFASKDGGFNWKQIEIAGVKQSVYAPDLISTSTVILDIIPISGKNKSASDGEFFISVFNAGEGALYRTENGFFTVEKITGFQKEAVYAMSVSGNDIYLGMSNGQLLRYNLDKKIFQTLVEFPEPIVEMHHASDGFYYIILKNGGLYRGASPYTKFVRVRIPGGGGLFSSVSLKQFAYDESGAIYVRTENGIYRSNDSGAQFKFYNEIPLLSKNIDTFFVSDGIRILSDGRLYVSSYEGVEWKVREVPYPRPVWNAYPVGGGKIILAQ